jgi:uncharacterized protein YjbI with pentapeptide repeats
MSMPFTICHVAGYELLTVRDHDTPDCVDFNHARLEGANFRGMHIGGSRFLGANCRGADFSGANASAVDFREADLTGANFERADLRGARFDGALLDWNARDVVVEILRQASGDDFDKLHFTGLILLRRDWTWNRLRALQHPMEHFLLASLHPLIRDDDNAPLWLRDPDQRSAI